MVAAIESASSTFTYVFHAGGPPGFICGPIPATGLPRSSAMRYPPASGGSGHLDEQVAREHVRIADDVGGGVARAGRDAGRGQRVACFVAGACLRPPLDARADHVVDVREPLGRARETGIVGPFEAADHAGKSDEVMSRAAL